MKNVLKLATTIFLVSIFLLRSVTSILAVGEFTTSATVTYAAQTNSTTVVTHEIVLTNKLSAVYATGYTLNLEGYAPTDVQAWDKKGPLTTNIEKSAKGAKINIAFNDQVVGTGGQLVFSIRYSQDGIVSHKGQIWEVTIPRQTDSASNEEYVVKLTTPKSFGKAAYISPQPVKSEINDDVQTYFFSKEEASSTRMVSAFGQFQIFDFDLNYSLKNDQKTSALFQIALPQDTPYQHVIYRDINPRPADIVVDLDGNWLASFALKEGETLNVQAKGSAQIFATPQTTENLSDTQRRIYLSPSDVWQTDDPRIQALANSLLTPREIYDYVVGHLTYNINRVKPDVKRLGAKAALDNPTSAICTEFTDLFIALARAAGIPAREVEGYAFTSDPVLEPLSLVQDVLHAWPEYWDDAMARWIQVDPTWGATTGGVDFFSKLDLNHFAFVIHGVSPHTPYPAGSYRTAKDQSKSVTVTFGQYQPQDKPQMKGTIIPNSLLQVLFGWQKGSIALTNQSGEALPNVTLTNSSSIRTENKEKGSTLAPFGTIVIPISYRLPTLFPWVDSPSVSVVSDIYTRKVDLDKRDIEKAQGLSFVIYFLGLTVLIFIIKIVKKLITHGK